MNQLIAGRTGKTIGRLTYKCECGKRMSIDVLPNLTTAQEWYLTELFDQKKCPKCYADGMR